MERTSAAALINPFYIRMTWGKKKKKKHDKMTDHIHIQYMHKELYRLVTIILKTKTLDIW